jgi:flavin-dependent dehydrogenase
MRFLPTDVQPPLERACTHAELHVHDIGARFVVRRTEPLVGMAMRADLDAALLAAAARRGAEVRAACRAGRVAAGPAAVEIETAGGIVRARWLVAADGVQRRVAAGLGWPATPSIPALEAEVRVDPADFERLAGAARFDFGPVPHGYAWVFPKADHLSIGVLSARRGP